MDAMKECWSHLRRRLRRATEVEFAENETPETENKPDINRELLVGSSQASLSDLTGSSFAQNNCYIILRDALVALVIYIFLAGMIGNPMLPPQGSLFIVFVMFVSGYVVGQIDRTLFNLPPFLGMMVVGLAFGISEVYQKTDEYIRSKWIVEFRILGLTMILVRAGLVMDLAQLSRNAVLTFILSVVPGTMEMITVAFLSQALLPDFNTLWGFTLGGVLVAVAQSIVLGNTLLLMNRGCAVRGELLSVLLAASGVDLTFSISLFSVFIGIVSYQGSVWQVVVRTLFHTMLGVCVGLIFGVTLILIPHRNDPYVWVLRTLLLVAGDAGLLLGARRLRVTVGGIVAALVASITVSQGWKSSRFSNLQNPVSQATAIAWLFFLPVVYTFLGADIDVFFIYELGIHNFLIVILTGVTVRCLSIFLLTWKWSRLSSRERIYVSISWIPRATAQAVMGPLVLEMVEGERNLKRAQILMQVAASTVLVLVPLGSVAMLLIGSRLLRKSSTLQQRSPGPETL